jgi:hypothetical protein
MGRMREASPRNLEADDAQGVSERAAMVIKLRKVKTTRFCAEGPIMGGKPI